MTSRRPEAGTRETALVRIASPARPVGPARPVEIEREVARLRDECTRMIGELERRWDRVALPPRRVVKRLRGAGEALGREVRERPVLVALGAVVLGGVLTLAVAAARPKRRGLWERILV